MRIEKIPFWLWMIVGILIGLGMGYLRVQSRYQSGASTDPTKNVRAEILPVDAEGMDMNPFLSGLTVKGIMTDVTIYRQSAASIVVFRKTDPVTKTAKDYYFKIPDGWTPYVAIDDSKPIQLKLRSLMPLNLLKALKVTQPDKGWPTAAAFFDDVIKANPNLAISYRKAWWYEPRWIYAMWGAGGFVVVGVIWPLAMFLLVRLGFGRPPEPEEEGVNLRKVRSRPTKSTQPAKASMTQADMDQLAEIEKALEANLKGSGHGHAVEATAEQTEQPVRKLTATKLEIDPAAAMPPKKEHEFVAKQDDFYPVERPKVKKEDEKKPSA